MDKNGELIKCNTDAYTVRGDTTSFGSGSSNPAAFAPVFTDGANLAPDSENSHGAVGDTGSAPMFEKFYRGQLDHVTGSQSAASVPGSALVEGGAKSDPQDQELANEQSLGAGAKSSQADKD